jgi:plasmid maintenance system killer protein
MSDPEFLDLEDVLAIHREQLARYGGGSGIRDSGQLESAMATPRATFGGSFVHADIFNMAAAYAFHIAENQLDAASAIRDLDLPGNRLEALKGDRKGQYSIRINDQWRIGFAWPDRSPGPTDVEIVDYH